MKLSGKAVLYMALVFASGAVLGVVGNRSYAAYTAARVTQNKNKERRQFTPDDYKRRYISFMEHRLSLTADQSAQLGVILDDTRAKFDELQQRIGPEQAAIGQGQTDKIRAMLNEEQRAQYEVMLKERDELRNKNKRKGGKGGRPGGPGF